MLLRAYQAYEDETGPHGLPLYLSRSQDPGVVFHIEEQIDGAQQALEQYDEQMSKRKSPPRGLSRWVVARDSDGNEIEISGLRRERFFIENAEVTNAGANDYEQELLEQGLIEKRPPGGYDSKEYGDGLVDSATTG